MNSDDKENLSVAAIHERENKIFYQDFEYISNDPAENADNFDPKWAALRELNTDEERYYAIRKRWGNSDIPDPSTCLTVRHKYQPSPNDVNNGTSLDQKIELLISSPARESRARNAEPSRASRRRSRSCTRPYEQLITKMEKNYFTEYCQLMFKQKNELEEMLQIQSSKLLIYNFAYPNKENVGAAVAAVNLQMQQKQEVFNMLNTHYAQLQNFIGKKTENIEACKRYMEEVKAFFTFYQKMKDAQVNLQMTDEQYEHTIETERMYSMYCRFYN